MSLDLSRGGGLAVTGIALGGRTVLPQVLRQRECGGGVKQKRHVELGAKVIKGL